MTTYWQNKKDIEVAAEKLGYLSEKQLFEETDLADNPTAFKLAEMLGKSVKNAEQLRSRNTELAEKIYDKTKNSCCCCGGCCK